MKGNDEAVEWAVLWQPEGGELLQESYVNLIPTAQGGTHVNGLRKYPDLGNEYYAKQLLEMIESLNGVRGFLHDNDASNIKL